MGLLPTGGRRSSFDCSGASLIPYNTLQWLAGKDYKPPVTKEGKFRHQLIWGRSYELMLGFYLSSLGFDVSLAPATDVEGRANRQTTPDLLVNGKRVECKSNKVAFSANPAKFPTKLVELDSVSSWTRKAIKPDYYVFISKRNWNAIWTHGNSSINWTLGKAHGKPYYLCDRANFLPLSCFVLEFKT